ncbi:ABC transporter ATP-binding protein [Streptomyces europaeiscabiei]|uniref:ABC transporter ATP-binding protein n=2 Tax=Streptomyces europaeiscabiei TaxID=146819 RepID=UPI0029B754C1|nr:ABC transporter ATP-binding protein [Streptomyces europaeiscabiei]MDX2756908.1 ABC transporter ATP-binding protein [Streptomyces europaeiscabiei]MDX2757009.1 ABC transporter ATP-binding protein [Streptomyces europaeiscabiei]MDX2766704.1 ABC transporter ATP-binding protein [Streptomyces europaeiscabiei]MDX3665564.1 ABC transporter ATP-binding protein [Streptomyces europaeiscabiei]
MNSYRTTAAYPVLVAAGLKKSYALTRALAGVDVSVSAGESLAIMGPSGSGKSTLLHCLAGIELPDEGQVMLAGERSGTGVPLDEAWVSVDELGEPHRSELRRTRFGFVFQSGQLLPELPADENVALPLMLGGMSRRQAVQKAREWFPPLGLAGMEERRPGQLSGGQAQRVAIARALVGGPQVIFADEPTGALDQVTGMEVIDLLVTTTRRQGAALVVVTHDEDVARRCDRTVRVRDGRLGEDHRTPDGAAGANGAAHAARGTAGRPADDDADARYDR